MYLRGEHLRGAAYCKGHAETGFPLPSNVKDHLGLSHKCPSSRHSLGVCSFLSAALIKKISLNGESRSADESK